MSALFRHSARPQKELLTRLCQALSHISKTINLSITWWRCYLFLIHYCASCVEAQGMRAIHGEVQHRDRCCTFLPLSRVDLLGAESTFFFFFFFFCSSAPFSRLRLVADCSSCFWPDQFQRIVSNLATSCSCVSRHCSGPTTGLTKMQNDFLMEGGSQAALPSSSWVCPRRPVLPSSPSSSAAPASLLALRPCLLPSASSPGSADKGQQQPGLGHATNNY